MKGRVVRRIVGLVCLIGVVAAGVVTVPVVHSETKAEKSFTAVVTDAQGVETEMKNVVFYWEEKLSETAFVPHELRHLPVKRGNSTINVRFDQIKQVENKSPGSADALALVITLHNGKTGEFALSILGSFRGESDFGQADVPVKGISKVVFK
jgi:hypothetical protein